MQRKNFPQIHIFLLLNHPLVLFLFVSFFFLSFFPFFLPSFLPSLLHSSVHLFFIRLLIYLFFILSSFFPLQFSSSLRHLTCVFLRSFLRYSFNCFIRSFVLSLLLSFICFLTQLFINLSFPSKHYRRHPTPRHVSSPKASGLYPKPKRTHNEISCTLLIQYRK